MGRVFKIRAIVPRKERLRRDDIVLGRNNQREEKADERARMPMLIAEPRKPLHHRRYLPLAISRIHPLLTQHLGQQQMIILAFADERHPVTFRMPQHPSFIRQRIRIHTLPAEVQAMPHEPRSMSIPLAFTQRLRPALVFRPIPRLETRNRKEPPHRRTMVAAEEKRLQRKRRAVILLKQLKVTIAIDHIAVIQLRSIRQRFLNPLPLIHPELPVLPIRTIPFTLIIAAIQVQISVKHENKYKVQFTKYNQGFKGFF